MRPIRVFDVMIPEAVMSKLVAGESLIIERKNKVYQVDGVPVEVRPRLARPVNWREEKKHRAKRSKNI